MLDPRIDDLFEEVKKLKEAIMAIANTLQCVAYRVSSDEEKKGLDIPKEIRGILEKK